MLYATYTGDIPETVPSQLMPQNTRNTESPGAMRFHHFPNIESQVFDEI